MNIKPLFAVEISERDGHGCWSHPEFTTYLNEVLKENKEGLSISQFIEMKRYFHIELTLIYMDLDPNTPEELNNAYQNGENIIHRWVPTPPDSDDKNWFLFSIDDTEDGPCAWWAKSRTPLPQSQILSLGEIP